MYEICNNHKVTFHEILMTKKIYLFNIEKWEHVYDFSMYILYGIIASELAERISIREARELLLNVGFRTRVS